MKKKPLLIKLLALALWLSPLGICVVMINSYPIPLEYWYLVFTPALWHWQIVTAAVVSCLVGVAVWVVKPWSYYVLVGYAILLVINNLILWIFSLSGSSFGMRVILVAGIVVMVVIALQKEFMSPYFNPQLRWWEQAKRYQIPEGGAFKIAVHSFKDCQKLFDAATFDISTKGCFIVSDFAATISQVFHFDIVLPEGRSFHTTGEVVWVHSGSNQTPQGFGCRFQSVEPAFVTELHKAVRTLNLRMRTER